MTFDLVMTGARLAGQGKDPLDIGVSNGRILALGQGLATHARAQGAIVDDAGGRLVIAGLVETHVHLDKSGLSDRCDCGGGTLAEAVAAVTAAKRDFTETDVYARARATLERFILNGVTRMRTHVEVDPRIGLTSLRALQRLKRDYAWAVDLTLCAFPQEGLIDDPGCEAVLIAALEAGADLVGGAPYMDRDSYGHIERIFDIARRFDVDIDFHLDFSLDPNQFDTLEVCRQTEARGWGGRVAIGHVTALSILETGRFASAVGRLAEADVAVTILPSTDLFLARGQAGAPTPRGVTPAHLLRRQGVVCSISTNNVLNPFTPFGDGSPIRMANLFANIAQIGAAADLAACFGMITADAARLMRLADYGVAPGLPADLIVLDCETEAQAVARIVQPLRGYKNGRQTFERPAGRLLSP